MINTSYGTLHISDVDARWKSPIKRQLVVVCVKLISVCNNNKACIVITLGRCNYYFDLTNKHL